MLLINHIEHLRRLCSQDFGKSWKCHSTIKTKIDLFYYSAFRKLSSVRDINRHVLYQFEIEVTHYLAAGEISVASLYKQIYLAAKHRRDFGCCIIQTDLTRRWASARFRLLNYTDRITSPLNIGEISVASLYRQNYLAAEYSHFDNVMTQFYLR